MKKLVFMFVAVAAISFASCGNKTEQAAPVDADSLETVEDTLAQDTLAQDSVEAPADSTVAE